MLSMIGAFIIGYLVISVVLGLIPGLLMVLGAFFGSSAPVSLEQPREVPPSTSKFAKLGDGKVLK